MPSDKGPHDEAPPPPLTAAQKARIKRSPAHVRLRRATYGALFIFHYVVASIFNMLWLVYTAVLFWHVKYGGFPDQIKIDIGWVMMADAFGCCFLFYIYYKMRTYGIPDMFNLACASGCGAKLQFVKQSPLVLAITSILLGFAQLFLCIRVYKNPLVQIPLDAHGRFEAIDCEEERNVLGTRCEAARGFLSANPQGLAQLRTWA
ncbi:hypothetical protein JCM3774_002363 [Rhodotorula dairenensis]